MQAMPQELSALMALDEGLRSGKVSPITPSGEKTVALQQLEAAQQQMSPAVGQVAQQAGLAAQLQAMQMQRAQQAMMQQAMAQQQPVMAAAGGLMSLNPQMDDFDEGGIVGYAPGGVSQEFGGSGDIDRGEPRLRVPGPQGQRMMTPAEMRAEKYPEEYIQRRLEMEGFISRPERAAPPAESSVVDDLVRDQAPPPAAPPAAPAARERGAFTPSQALGIVAPLFEKQRAELGKIRTDMPTPEEVAAQDEKERQSRREMLIRRGLDPDYLDKREAQGKALFEQQQALLRERMERERGKDTFLGRMGEALRNFQQLQGEGIGRGLVRSEAALGRRLAASEAAVDELKNLELRAMELDMTRRNALEDARHATAIGDFNRAQQSLTAARNAENEKARLVAGTYGPQATAAVQERQVAASEAARADSVKARSEQSLDAQLSRSIDVLRRTENDIRSKYKDPLERFSTMRAASQGNLPEGMAREEARLIAQRDSEIRSQTANIRNQIRALETQRFGAPIEPEVRMTATMEDMRATAAKRNVPVETVIAQAKAKGYTITGQ